VALRLHSVIYRLIHELQDELSSRLPPRRGERVVGESTGSGVSPQEVVWVHRKWCESTGSGVGPTGSGVSPTGSGVSPQEVV